MLPTDHRLRLAEQGGHGRHARLAARRGRDQADQGEPGLALQRSRSRFPTRSASCSRRAGARRRGRGASGRRCSRATWTTTRSSAEELLRVSGRHDPKLPAIDEMPTFLPADDPLATRASSGKALNWLAPRVPELIGGAADLAPSTATNLDDYAEHHPPPLRRPQPPLRHPRARDGGDHQRDDDRGDARLRGDLLRLQRLHARRDPARGADGDPLDLRLHARLLLGRRGRAHARAGRAPRLAAGDAEHRGRAARRRERDVPRLALAARRQLGADGADPEPAEAAQPRARARSPTTRSPAAPTSTPTARWRPS